MGTGLKKRILCLWMLVCSCLLHTAGMSAQNDVQFTQYWAVPAYYNPGATGEIDFVRIRGGARMQWVGI